MRMIFTLFVVMGVMPLLTGLIFSVRDGEPDGSLAYAYLSGQMTLLGVFQLLAVPMSYLHTSLKLLCVSFLGAGALLGLAGAVCALRRRALPAIGRWMALCAKSLTPLLAAAVLCILFQMVWVTDRQHIDEDDAYYLGTAVTAVENNSLYEKSPYTGKTMKREPEARYVLAAWPLYIAILSKVSGVQATKLAHMALPAAVLFWCYLVYFLLAGYLFPSASPDDAGRRERAGKIGLFMFFVVLLHTFAGYSIFNAQVFVMIRSWQGKAVLAGVGLPALVFLCMRAAERSRWDANWWALLAGVAALTCLTTIGSIFAIITAGCFSLHTAFRKRSVRCLVYGMIACLPAFACCAVYLIKR